MGSKTRKFETKETKTKKEKDKEKEKTKVGVKTVSPRTINQNKYIKSMEKNTLTFGLGPGGSGKTLLAVSFAINQILLGKQNRLVITRPIVEAGENLGFLPGSFTDKVDPYLRPVYDFIIDILGATHYKNWLAAHVEVAPLAYMRGRTFDNSILILDEAQNTIREQMMLFLTRIGNNSKAIVTADPSQIDLKDKSVSGVLEAALCLTNRPSIGIIEFVDIDVLRSDIVKTIIESYKSFRKDRPLENKKVNGHGVTLLDSDFHSLMLKEDKNNGGNGGITKTLQEQSIS
jgi:phosphate starvation-inducible protein PhoH and related proteins